MYATCEQDRNLSAFLSDRWPVKIRVSFNNKNHDDEDEARSQQIMNMNAYNFFKIKYLILF